MNNIGSLTKSIVQQRTYTYNKTTYGLFYLNTANLDQLRKIFTTQLIMGAITKQFHVSVRQKT